MAAVQSRIQILDLPVALPGHCVVCGSVGGDDRKFVDFGFTQDWFGVIYFCTYCMNEITEAIGEYVTQTKYQEVIEKSVKNYDRAEGLVSQVRRIGDVLRGLGIDPDRNYGDTVSSIPPSVEVLPDDAGSNIVAENNDPVVDKPVRSKKSRSVRSTTADSSASDDAIEFLNSLDS